MIDLDNIFILAQKEISDARRNRWFLLFALAFTGLSLALAWAALAGTGTAGLAGFGRTSATLINLVLLFVPLMGLTLGALSLASERENGTLLYMLAQPVTQLEILLGKFAGLALALMAALGLGFGLTAALLALNGSRGDAGIFLTLLLLACLLAIACLSLGLLLSAASKRATTAVGLALFLWLLLVFAGDLGLMGSALILELDVQQLLLLALANPLQVFKIAAVLDLRQNLEVLGPAGIFAYRTYGTALLPLLVALLVLWVALPLGAAAQLFKKKGAI